MLLKYTICKKYSISDRKQKEDIERKAKRMALIFFQPQADLLFFSSAARFKGVNLAPKGEGVSVADG